MKRILVIEDDKDIVELVKYNLEKDGFQVATSGDGATGLAQIRKAPPDLLILDLMLPKLSGLEICKEVRKDVSLNRLPVLILTAKGEEADRVVGLELGADDYVTKPFSPRELTMRVRSVLRRARGTGLQGVPSLGVLGDGDLAVDLGAHEARLKAELVALTAREYDLLVFLMRHPRQAFTREELLDQVWNWSFGDTSTVTVHVRRLREKLEADPAQPRRIATVWGVGYRYEPGES